MKIGVNKVRKEDVTDLLPWSVQGMENRSKPVVESGLLRVSRNDIPVVEFPATTVSESTGEHLGGDPV